MSMLRISLLHMLTALCTASISLAQDQPEYVPGIVVVQFVAGTPHKTALRIGLEEFDRKAAQYGVHTIERVYPFLDYVDPTPRTRQNLLALRRTYYVRYHSNAAPKLVADDLDLTSGIVYAEPVGIDRAEVLQRSVVPNDPAYNRQSYLRELRLMEAWSLIKGEDGSPRVVIAVVDGGGEWRHKDLQANVWTNPGEIAGNGVDDDNNGFVDDVHGANFQSGDHNDPTGSSNTPDNTFHGAAVAGAVGAVTDNGVGIAGTAWNADVMYINASCANREVYCYAYEGVLYAAANGADVINASWSSLVDTEEVRFLSQTIDLATDMGSLIVASAGNQSSNLDHYYRYPARHPRVLAVGATEIDTRRLSDFSNYGQMVSVFAPGESILTTGLDDSYWRVGGTSLSAPLVAGIVALVKTRYPDMSPDRLHKHLRLTSENMDEENPPYAGSLGGGYVNALASLQSSPSSAFVRLKRWSWTDDDGNSEIVSGDEVTIKAIFMNYLAATSQLRVRISGAEPYPFLNWRTRDVSVGILDRGDSVEVDFRFSVDANAPVNQRVRLLTHAWNGTSEDSVGVLSLTVNKPVAILHQVLRTLYTSTNGDQWNNKSDWEIDTVPPNIEDFESWYGLSITDGALNRIKLAQNNLTGQIPPELGSLSDLEALHLEENQLTGTIPSNLENLSQLKSLVLSENILTGVIPSQLGNLVNLTALHLESNQLIGEIPSELCNLSQLKDLRLSKNDLIGALPRCFLGLQNLNTLYFTDGGVCAPPDAEFQAWLSTITNVAGPECGNMSFSSDILDQFYPRTHPIAPLKLPQTVGGRPPIMYSLTPSLPTGLKFNPLTRTLSGTPTELITRTSFAYVAIDANGVQDTLKFSIEVYPPVRFTASIDNQAYPRTHPIMPVVLPEVGGGRPPITYTLTPALPEGLSFDPSTRTLSGTPNEVIPSTSFAYTATDVESFWDWLVFKIEVYSSVSTEQEGLPAEFAVHASYPNPFQYTTRIQFDLPWPARVGVEVLDVTGRHMFTQPSVGLSAGWGQEILLNGMALPSGAYLYRLKVESAKGAFVHSGHFVRIR